MALWPLPKELTSGTSTLWLSPELQFTYFKAPTQKDGTPWYRGLERSPSSNAGFNDLIPKFPEDLVDSAFHRFKDRILHSSIVPYKFHPKKASFEPDFNAMKTTVKKIELEEQSTDRLSLSQEAYALELSLNPPGIKIKTVAPEGALRAFETLALLFYSHSASSQSVYTPYAPVRIRDTPHFDHRGVLLDISRNWIPPADVIRSIDAMAFNKLNKLHLHASDSQSWPLEISAYPTLAKEGAYREDQVWSVEDLKNVQSYGLYRGVEVFLEIDMPGHTGAITHSHPDLITAYNKRPWGAYAQEPPSGQLKLNSTEVDTFLANVLQDLLVRVSPFSSHFHIGGDELNREVYKLDSTVNSSDKEVIRPYLQKFMDRAVSHVTSKSLIPHVWEDMLTSWDLKFPTETVFQSWQPGGLAKIVDKGYRGIFGEYNEWYLDCGFGTFIDPDPMNPGSTIRTPFLDWATPYKNWRRVLAYDPLKDIPKDKQHLVVGGEVCLWGELTDSVNLDFMLWPRAAAAAEMMWRGKGEVGESTTRRLAEMRERLVKMGIRAGMVQMEWALRNQGECIL